MHSDRIRTATTVGWEVMILLETESAVSMWWSQMRIVDTFYDDPYGSSRRSIGDWTVPNLTASSPSSQLDNLTRLSVRKACQHAKWQYCCFIVVDWNLVTLFNIKSTRLGIRPLLFHPFVYLPTSLLFFFKAFLSFFQLRYLLSFVIEEFASLADTYSLSVDKFLFLVGTFSMSINVFTKFFAPGWNRFFRHRISPIRW